MAMAEQILQYLEQAGVAISLFAVAVIIAGFALAAARYTFRFRKVDLDQNFLQFKIQLGNGASRKPGYMRRIFSDRSLYESERTRGRAVVLNFIKNGSAEQREANSGGLALQPCCWRWSAPIRHSRPRCQYARAPHRASSCATAARSPPEGDPLG